jgi:hypothetical protein
MLQMLGMEGAARWLMDKGIKGRPGAAGACVLAEYFQRQTGEKDIHVSSHITVKGWSMPCPPVLRALWGKFDRGEFPDLVGEPIRREEQLPSTEPAVVDAELTSAE